MTLCSGEILRWVWGRMGGRSDGAGAGAGTALEHAADPWPSSSSSASSGSRARTASLLSVARCVSFWPRAVQPLAATMAVPRALTPRAGGAAGCRVPAAFRCQMLAAESWTRADADCGSPTGWMKGVDGMVPWSVSACEFLRDGVEEEAHREMAALVEAGRGGREQILEEQATAASCAGAGGGDGPGAGIRWRDGESGMSALCRAGGDSVQELVAGASWNGGRSEPLVASELELSEADSLCELPGEGVLWSFRESRRPLRFMFAFGKDAFACSVKTIVSYGCKSEWKVLVFVQPAPASDAVADHGYPGVWPVRKCSIPCGEHVDCVLCRIYRNEPRLTWESVEYPCETVVERTSSSGSDCGVASLEVLASSYPASEFPVLVAPAADHGHPGFCPRSMCNPGEPGGEHVECVLCRIYRKQLRLTWEAAGAGYSGHAVSDSIPLCGSDCGVEFLEGVECGPRPSGLVCETKREHNTPPSVRFTGDPVKEGGVSFSCSETGGACVQVVPCTSQGSNSWVARFVGGSNETVSELVCTGRIAPPPFRLSIQVSLVEETASMLKFPFCLMPRLEFNRVPSLRTGLQGQEDAHQMAIDGGVRSESCREARRLARRSPSCSLRPYNSLDKLAGEGEKECSGLLGSDNLLLECESQAAHRMNMLIILSEAAEIQERGLLSEAWRTVLPKCISQETSETCVETIERYAALPGVLSQSKSDAANSRRSSVVRRSVVLVSEPVNITLMREYIEGWLWYGAYQMSMETLVPEAAGAEGEQQSIWPDSGNLFPECLSQAAPESVSGTVAREKKTAEAEVMGLTSECDCRSTIEMYADTGRGSSGGQGAGSVDEVINLKSIGPKHCKNKQGKAETLGWVVRLAVAVVAQRKKAMKTNRLPVRNRGRESQEMRNLTGGRANDWLNASPSPVSFLWMSGAKAKLSSLWSAFFPTSRPGAAPAPALSGGELVTGPRTGGAARESDLLPKTGQVCLFPAKSVPDSPAHGSMMKVRNPMALSRQPISLKPKNFTRQSERRKAALRAISRYKRILTFLEPFQLPALRTLKTRRFNC